MLLGLLQRALCLVRVVEDAGAPKGSAVQTRALKFQPGQSCWGRRTCLLCVQPERQYSCERAADLAGTPGVPPGTWGGYHILSLGTGGDLMPVPAGYTRAPSTDSSLQFCTVQNGLKLPAMSLRWDTAIGAGLLVHPSLPQLEPPLEPGRCLGLEFRIHSPAFGFPFPGSEIDCADKYGNTPLHVAARYGHELLISTLMTNGADTAR